jgi:hypothetical protein
MERYFSKLTVQYRNQAAFELNKLFIENACLSDDQKDNFMYALTSIKFLEKMMLAPNAAGLKSNISIQLALLMLFFTVMHTGQINAVSGDCE